MSSAGLSPILPIFCDVCAQDFNSVDTAVTHFTFKKHWTVRNSCVKPAILEKHLSQHFRIIVIPSIVLSFLPDYCHSFQIIVIPSGLQSFLLYQCTDKNIIPIYLFLVKTSKKWNLYFINLEARFCQNCLVEIFQKLEKKNQQNW